MTVKGPIRKPARTKCHTGGRHLAPKSPKSPKSQAPKTTFLWIELYGGIYSGKVQFGSLYMPPV